MPTQNQTGEAGERAGSPGTSCLPRVPAARCHPFALTSCHPHPQGLCQHHCPGAAAHRAAPCRAVGSSRQPPAALERSRRLQSPRSCAVLANGEPYTQRRWLWGARSAPWHHSHVPAECRVHAKAAPCPWRGEAASFQPFPLAPCVTAGSAPAQTTWDMGCHHRLCCGVTVSPKHACSGEVAGSKGSAVLRLLAAGQPCPASVVLQPSIPTGLPVHRVPQVPTVPATMSRVRVPIRGMGTLGDTKGCLGAGQGRRVNPTAAFSSRLLPLPAPPGR